MPMSDLELLRAFAGSADQSAFAELVRRRIDFVYAAALRMAGRSGTFVIARAALGVEALAGNGELEQARKLGLRILEHDGSAETLALVRSHLARAGHPDLLKE